MAEGKILYCGRWIDPAMVLDDIYMSEYDKREFLAKRGISLDELRKATTANTVWFLTEEDANKYKTK